MHSPGKYQILLTNDDGIQSPGLWAAAEGLASLGFVHVVAPREQSSGTGRSFPSSSDGRIEPQSLNVHGKDWTVYAVGGTPAQAVVHGVLEVLPRWPDLVVSGINYGENMGTSVTVSGTVGAALEAASLGIPALAVSLQTHPDDYYSYSMAVNFSVARHFTTLFANLLLERKMPADVDLFKIDIPDGATLDTPWELTRQSRHRYYAAIPPRRTRWDEPVVVDYQIDVDPSTLPKDSDIYALLVKKVVSVTPLSIDLTSRVNLEEFGNDLRK